MPIYVYSFQSWEMTHWKAVYNDYFTDRVLFIPSFFFLRKKRKSPPGIRSTMMQIGCLWVQTSTSLTILGQSYCLRILASYKNSILSSWGRSSPYTPTATSVPSFIMLPCTPSKFSLISNSPNATASWLRTHPPSSHNSGGSGR